MELFYSVLILITLTAIVAVLYRAFLFKKSTVISSTAQMDEIDRAMVKKYEEVDIHANRPYTMIGGLAVAMVFTLALTELAFAEEIEEYTQATVENVAEETFEIELPPEIELPKIEPEVQKTVVLVETEEELIEEPEELIEEPEEKLSFNPGELEDLEEEEEEEKIAAAPEIWTTTEVRAMPKLGMMAFNNTLMQAITPKLSSLGSYLDDVSPGVVMLNFVVLETGKVSTVQVMQGVDPKVDQIVSTVFAQMAEYNPGMNQGRPVRSMMQYPVMIAFE